MIKKIFTFLIIIILLSTFLSNISARDLNSKNRDENKIITTEENTTQLSIEFRQLLGKDLNITIVNNGQYNASNVYYELIINGGILGLIDGKINGTLENDLKPGEEFIVKIPVFGLGFVDINAKTNSSNSEIIEKENRGLVILNYVLILGGL